LGSSHEVAIWRCRRYVGASWTFAATRAGWLVAFSRCVSLLGHLLRTRFWLIAHSSGYDAGACSRGSCTWQCLTDGVIELGWAARATRRSRWRGAMIG